MSGAKALVTLRTWVKLKARGGRPASCAATHVIARTRL